MLNFFRYQKLQERNEKMKLMKNHKKINALLLTASIGFNSILGSNVPMAKASNTFSITKKVTIGVGENYKLNTSGSTEGITFKSSNKKIVSVTKKGKITGKKKGTTTIIAKVKKQNKSCKVTVKPAAKGIKIKNGNLTLHRKCRTANCFFYFRIQQIHYIYIN